MAEARRAELTYAGAAVNPGWRDGYFHGADTSAAEDAELAKCAMESLARHPSDSLMR